MATGIYRCLFSTANNRLFSVVGSSMYEIFQDATHILRGNINSVKGIVSITENETQLLLVDGVDGWIYDLIANTLTQIENYQDQVATVAVANGGTNYKEGDVVTISTPSGGAPATLSVDAVNTGGIIAQAGVTIITKGRGYSLGTYSTTSPNGTGATITVETLGYGGFKSASHCLTMDGFFICNEVNSGRFFWSNVRDGFTWDPLNYATAEGSPDNLLSMSKTNNELWLFGTKTTEIWFDTGNYASQFQRIQQGFVDIGIVAIRSNATTNDKVFWLGNNDNSYGIVYMAQNYLPKRISTNAIEYRIAKLPNIEDAVGYCYQQEGHHFYVLNFTEGNCTLVYDMDVGLWHERSFWNSTTDLNERHRGQFCAFCWNKVFISDYNNTYLYYYDLDTYTDNGLPIRRQRTGPHIRSDRKRLFHHEFEVDIERGVGLNSGQGSKPYITLTYSDDGGKTFGNERKLTIGSLGKNLTRAHTHRLGYSRDRVYRLTISEPIKIVLVGARADIEQERG